MTDPPQHGPRRDREEILARARTARKRRVRILGWTGAAIIAVGLALLLLGAPADLGHGVVIAGIVVVGIGGALGMFGSVGDGDGDPDRAAAQRVGMGFGVGQEAFRDAQREHWGMGGSDPDA